MTNEKSQFMATWCALTLNRYVLFAEANEEQVPGVLWVDLRTEGWNDGALLTREDVRDLQLFLKGMYGEPE